MGSTLQSKSFPVCAAPLRRGKKRREAWLVGSYPRAMSVNVLEFQCLKFYLKESNF